MGGWVGGGGWGGGGGGGGPDQVVADLPAAPPSSLYSLLSAPTSSGCGPVLGLGTLGGARTRYSEVTPKLYCRATGVGSEGPGEVRGHLRSRRCTSGGGALAEPAGDEFGGAREQPVLSRQQHLSAPPVVARLSRCRPPAGSFLKRGEGGVGCVPRRACPPCVLPPMLPLCLPLCLPPRGATP